MRPAGQQIRQAGRLIAGVLVAYLLAVQALLVGPGFAGSATPDHLAWCLSAAADDGQGTPVLPDRHDCAQICHHGILPATPPQRAALLLPEPDFSRVRRLTGAPDDTAPAFPPGARAEPRAPPIPA
jgi:hypothetical protein